MIQNTGKLVGKTLFITGASRGIGKAIALKAAKDGANVVVAAKTKDPHPKLPGTIYTASQEIEAAGGKALPCVVDVRNEAEVKQAIDLAVETFGGIDILINNASAISLTGTLQTPMKVFDLMHQINTRGTYMVSKHCIPHLARSSSAHILNLAPPLNMNPRWFKGHVGYTMAKYGMSMCVLGMAEEFKSKKIAVNALWPRTAIITAAMEMLGGEGVDAQCRKPEIMADAAYAILCRDSAKYTGNFAIDDEVLKEEGVTNFSNYAIDPKARLLPDFFLDEFDEEAFKNIKQPTGIKGKQSSPISSVFTSIKGMLDEELVTKIKAVYLFEITGEGTSKWYLDLKNGSGSCGEGEPSTPVDCTFKMDAENFVEMFNGKLNPTKAYMSGNLDISGDLTKAMSLEKFMSKMKSKM